MWRAATSVCPRCCAASPSPFVPLLCSAVCWQQRGSCGTASGHANARWGPLGMYSVWDDRSTRSVSEGLCLWPRPSHRKRICRATSAECTGRPSHAVPTQCKGAVPLGPCFQAFFNGLQTSFSNWGFEGPRNVVVYVVALLTMLCGLGVPSLRSFWDAVRNRQLYILRMYCRSSISFNLHDLLPKKNTHTHLLPKKILLLFS